MRTTLPLLLLALAPFPAVADTVTLGAAKDNTLVEAPGGFVSNGGGSYMFVGVTNQQPGEATRRAVLAFNIASIPAGSTINSVSLRLYMSRTNAVGTPVTMHRLSSDWGEGTSNAPGGEGSGTVATPGSATWLFTHYNTASWTTPGGDFDSTASATTIVDQAGFYTWSSPQLVADVQRWLDTPGTNFGWLLMGDESGPSGTAKRFSTRENGSSSQRPALTIEYTVPAPAAAVPLALGLIGLRRRR